MIIIISSPASLTDEHEIIRQLFNEELEIFHLRKNEYSESELRKFIELIPERHFKKIVLHSHYHLAVEYGLKGIHVPHTFRGAVPGRTVSISFHALEEIQKVEIRFDYGFLSPVFDSISKEGYKSRFNLNEVKLFLKHRNEKIIALGGIDEDKIETVKDLGFSGIALLGAIWQSEHPVDNYKRIKEKWLKQIVVY